MTKRTKILIFILSLVVSLSITILITNAVISAINGNQEKHFKDVDIVFFCGGDYETPFAKVVYNGAKAAEQDLGCHVEYIWSEWDTHKMAIQFKQAIEKVPDAICMMGHPGYNTLHSLVDEAIRKDIIVTFLNVDIPELRNEYRDKGCGYVGQQLYNSGLMLSQGSIRKYNLQPGDEAIVFGIDYLPETGRGLRSKGCINGLEQYGITTRLVPLTEVLENRPYSKEGEKIISDALKKYPGTDFIITDHGDVTSAIGSILKNLGIQPGDIFVSGFDLSINTVEAIREGYVGLVHDQQPYLQGYLSILQVCLSKKYDFSGLYIDTGVGLIDNSNIELLANLANNQIR